MSVPIVTSTDLGTYLGVAVDTDRATQLIAWAQALCESVVSPLPSGAEPVVLEVAARGYVNPTNFTSATVDSVTANYGAVRGGLWLTKGNKRTLRRLAGGGGAFMIDTMPSTAGQNLPVWDTGNVVSSDDAGWSGDVLP